MEITSVTIIKNMTAKTANGFYLIESHAIDKQLTRISVAVYSLSEIESHQEYIGIINYENGNISCNFQIPQNLAPYFEDFNSFRLQIAAEIEEQVEESKHTTNLASNLK